MFCFINNLRSAWRNKIASSLTSRTGQVAVILIIVIAIGLIFFAASINLTLVSQAKTLTMKAASMSASSTASFIASYGQKQYTETMGKRIRYCKSSGGGLMGILTIIVMIIIAVFAPEILAFLGGMPVAAVPEALSLGLTTAATMGAVMEGASMIIAASIDPGISKMWNRMQNANLSMTGQVMERGVQTALQSVVTDQGKLPDLYDMDMDGLFGYAAGSDPKKDPPKDTIGRFSFYNTKRFLALSGTDGRKIEEFLNALHELVLIGNDSWGLWDPVFYPDNTTHVPSVLSSHPCYSDSGYKPAECDYCCDNYESSDVPEGCSRTTCSTRSPFNSPVKPYPYVYDFSYEDSTNTFMSFREQLGRDDEHHLYHVNKDNSNWHSAPFPSQGQQSYSDADTGFYLKDVVGYYTSPYFTLSTPDIWISTGLSATPAPKLFPFLYKMRDWGPSLKVATYANYECHWCDTRSAYSCPGDIVSTYPEITRLSLPVDPSTLPHNKTQGWCVNKTNKGGDKDPPVIPDLVGGAPALYVANDACAIKPAPLPVSDLTKYVGGWKSGADRYCSNADGALYSLDCPKHGIASAPSDFSNPQCGEGTTAEGITPRNPSFWQDDMLDAIIYGMPELFDFERTLWRSMATGGSSALASSFVEWYGVASSGESMTNGISDWIEPPCPNPSACPGSFTKLARPGTLWIWRAELKWLNQQIQKWLVPASGSEYAGTLFGPDAAWCVPSFAAGNGSAPPAEILTFDINANGIRGDVADVIACLSWNARNVRTYTLPTVSATGNAEKFQRCFDSCGLDTCSNLPRSLIPDFYDGTKFRSGDPANIFDAGNTTDQASFNACLTSTTIATCTAKCDSPPLPSGSPYDLPAFVDPNVDKIANIDSFCTTNPTFNASSDLCNPRAVLNCGSVSSKNACKCSWAGSCSGFIGSWGCSDKSYFNAVTDALVTAKGSCSDSVYKKVIEDSAKEAKVQVAKFKKRLDFLQGRYDEAMALSNDGSNPLFDSTKPNGILTVAIEKLTDFLDNDTPMDGTDDSAEAPAERLIDARIKHTDAITGDLPAFAIYVWQDKDRLAGKERWGTYEGYWHAVKVEARIPRRCTGDCIATEWPKVFSKTSGGGFLKKTKICYTLINLEGITKARVIRYDQDKDLRGLLFPSGGNIWESHLSHPKERSNPNPGGIARTCWNLIDEEMRGWLEDDTDERRHLGAAFMLNRVPDLLNSDDSYTQCWNRVHRDLLDHGIQSEACAQYYFAGDGFRVKFVPCDRW